MHTLLPSIHRCVFILCLHVAFFGPFFVGSTFDLFDVMCKHLHLILLNPFFNGLKNGLKNATCKRTLTIEGSNTLYSPPGGVTLADGVSDFKNAVTAFEALDGSFVDKALNFDEIRVGAKRLTKYNQTCSEGRIILRQKRHSFKWKQEFSYYVFTLSSDNIIAPQVAWENWLERHDFVISIHW